MPAVIPFAAGGGTCRGWPAIEAASSLMNVPEFAKAVRGELAIYSVAKPNIVTVGHGSRIIAPAADIAIRRVCQWRLLHPHDSSPPPNMLNLIRRCRVALDTSRHLLDFVCAPVEG
jgi:hypothetical protein